jgi:hypothetical protein
MERNLILLSDPVTRRVFELIAKNRTVKYKELWRDAESTTGNYSDVKAELDERLEQLKHARLIAEESAPIADFNIYYLTADGLSVERRLRAAAA